GGGGRAARGRCQRRGARGGAVGRLGRRVGGYRPWAPQPVRQPPAAAEPPPDGGRPGTGTADLRDLGLWMRVIGWFEVLAGTTAGGLWVLARVGLIPPAWLDAAAPDWRWWKIPALATVGFGLLPRRAAAPVRRAARAVEPLPPETAMAVERLKDLFEAQAILLLLAVAIAIVSTFL